MSALLQVKDKIEPERDIKAAPFKKDIRKTTAHKHHNYFEIIYLAEGSGYHFIDSCRYEVKPPLMFFVRKEQVHYWELDTEPRGFVVIIKKSFIEKSLDSALKSLFTRLSGQNSLQLENTTSIEKLFELLTEENKTTGKNDFYILEGLLKALLAKVLEIAKPVINEAEFKTDLFQSLLTLLNSGKVVKNSVQHYADQLNTSPQNLNAACRKATNQSAAEVLAEYIISESKRLLLYTNNTVSEIAFNLDFIDASHFVKYFKRNTGQTPQAFRLSNG